MILAASIGEPPPSARITSGWKELARARPLRTTASVGSAVTSKKHSTSMPRCFRMAMVSSTEPMLEQEVVGHDQAALAPAQVVQRERQAAAAEIDRARQLVPQHVLGPLGDGLAVQQMLRARRSRKSSCRPRSRSPGSAMAPAWKLYRSPMPPCVDGVLIRMRAGLHPCAEGRDTIGLQVLVGVEHRGMAQCRPTPPGPRLSVAHDMSGLGSTRSVRW